MGDNCALVTYAANPDLHVQHDVKQEFDIGFIGKPYYEERNGYLELLTKYYGDRFLNLNNFCQLCLLHKEPEKKNHLKRTL